MNNQFLQHLKSITPDGKAEEKKIFIPADKFKPKTADKIDMGNEVEDLDEATRSKYIKAYRKHKVGTDTGKLDIEDAKRNAAVLRRGGADDETIRKGSFTGKTPMSHYNKVNMAKYRFGNKAQRSRVNEDMELGEGSMSSQRIRRKYNKKGTKDRSVLDKMTALASRRALRGGASPEDVKNRSNDPKANVRSLNGLINFHDTMRKKSGLRSRIAEGSLGMKKGIRMSNAVMNKGHTQIGNRAQAAELRAISKINKETGGSGRITTIPLRYKFSDAEFAAMQGHAKKGIVGKMKYNAVRRARLSGRIGGPEMNEGKINKKYKKTKKTAKRILKKIGRALSTPQDAVDAMYTGRNF